MTAELNLSKLAEPFPAEDVEWRVSRAGTSGRGVFCMVLAYITARAIQKRLDEVCGPQNWRNEAPQMIDVIGKTAFCVGISIRINGEWITKYDVCEPTNIEAAKGGFSGAMKRAGAQWGIGRYLYHLDETFAEVKLDDSGGKGWNYARLPMKDGGAAYYWKTPSLPGWALPKEPEHEISAGELNSLKRAWKDKFAVGVKGTRDLRDGFHRFVTSTVGEFPHDDYTLWTRDALEQCHRLIDTTIDAKGISGDVPFGE